MPYTKVHEDWEDLPSTATPIDAAALEQMEQGIADAQDDADSANSSIGDHIADSSGAHTAGAISFSPTGSIGSATVQAAVAEVASDAAADLAAHTGDSTAAHAASAVSFSPVAGIVATDVQAAIAEVRNDVSVGEVDSVVAGTGIDVDDTDQANPVVSIASGVYRSGGTDVAVADGGTGASTAADARTNLGLGTMAVEAAADYVAKAGGTMTGDLSVPDEAYDATSWNGSVEVPTKNAVRDEMENRVSGKGGGKEILDTHGAAAVGTTETIDLANGNVHKVILDENCTLTFTGSTASVACSFTLVVVQDGTGGNSITWPASVDWPGAAAPTQSTGANDVDIYTFVTIDNGTTWYGFQAGKDMG